MCQRVKGAMDVVEDKGRRHSNIYNQMSRIMRKGDMSWISCGT